MSKRGLSWIGVETDIYSWPLARLPPHIPIWHKEDEYDEQSPETYETTSTNMTRTIKSRRTHQKSRLGCSNCKRRRIKVCCWRDAVFIYPTRSTPFNPHLVFPSLASISPKHFIPCLTLFFHFSASTSAGITFLPRDLSTPLTPVSAMRKGLSAPTVQTMRSNVPFPFANAPIYSLPNQTVLKARHTGFDPLNIQLKSPTQHLKHPH